MVTNLWLAVLSTVLTLAILGGFWVLHGHITSCFFTVTHTLQQTERSLRSHVVDEIDNLGELVSGRVSSIHGRIESTEDAIINFVKEHTDDLRKHAEDLRNHAKELSDRAEVQSASPRQAVTRN